MAATESSLGVSLSGAGQEYATRTPPPTKISSFSGTSELSRKIILSFGEFALSSFTPHRFPAPCTVIPEFFGDAPFAGTAFMLATGYLPGPFDFIAAPRAVAHERHKRFATAAVRTTCDVTLVLEVSVGFCLEAPAVAPGAIIPISFDAALAARTMCRHTSDRAARRIIEAAPGTGLHALSHRTFATAALVPRFQRRSELPLELTPLQLPPGGTGLGRFSSAISFAALSLAACTAVELLERRVHLDRVSVAIGRIELDGLP